MNKKLTLPVIALACAGAAHAQLGRTQDWNTFGADIGRSGHEKTDPFINKESVARDFALLYKTKLDENGKGQRSVTPPVIISILISYRGFKELAFSASTNNLVSALNVDAGKIFWQKPLIYSSDIPQVKDPTQPCSGGLAPAVSLVPAPAFGGFGRGGRGANPAPAAAAPRPVATGRGLGTVGFGGSRPVLVLASDGRLHRLNSANGDDMGGPPTRFVPPNTRPSMLNVADNVVYTSVNQGCGAVDNSIWAIDFAGESPSVASFPTRGGGVWGAGGVAIGSDNTVYAQLGDGAHDPSANKFANTLVALSPVNLTLKQYFTPPDLPAAPKNPGMSAATPVFFTWKGRNFVASSGKDGRVYLLDAALVGGQDHKTFLSRSSVLSDGATPDRGIYGLASWEDETQTRWVAASVWGPSGVSGSPNGAIVAFKVEDNGGMPELKQAWASRDITAPVPPSVAGGVLFALGAGDYTRTVKEGYNGNVLVEEKPKPAARATLYALDAATGKELWSSKQQIAGPAALTGLTVANGRVYFGATDSTFYCFGIPLEH